jgi:hypothetical protein
MHFPGSLFSMCSELRFHRRELGNRLGFVVRSTSYMVYNKGKTHIDK